MPDSEVIVVGAGPVGATTALLLAAHGVTTTVVDSRRAPRTHPAAHVLSTRSLEIWREIGLERDIRRMSAPLSHLRAIVYCTSLSGAELGRVPLMDLPAERLDAIESTSPTRAAHLSQNTLEALLWTRMQSCEKIEFHPGWSYQSHTEHGHGVSVTVADADTAVRHELPATYLIAADGAASTARAALRIAMEGPLLQHVVSVHFSADIERFVRNRRGPVLWTHTRRGVGTIIAHRPPDDLVFHIPYLPPVQSLSDFTPARCRDHIITAIGDRSVDVDIKGVQTWAMTAQLAATYRSGRAFLVGDAAHRFPPTGGLGLNTGVADAHNLAWKLAWVLSGRAGESLLDSYEAERRPIAVQACADSVANVDGLFDVLAALGLSRRAARALPTLVSRLPRWAPQPVVHALLGVISSLGYQRLRLAAGKGPVGRRIRRCVSSVIVGQGPHYRSFGRDLGVQYEHGALLSDRHPSPTCDAQYYTPRLRAGARLPHLWIIDGRRRISTLDIVAHDVATVLVATSQREAWSNAAAGLPIHVRVIDDPALWGADLNDCRAEAIVVRPDGHVAALLGPADNAEGRLRQALESLGAAVAERSSA